jgi:predicted protein tyrosine phosphatase
VRVNTEDVPTPYAKNLEYAYLPNKDVLDVADKLESLGKSGRVIEQITSAGTAGMDQARTARWART